uniref:META domain-containing protein n=1 Tax=uncultured Sphingomonas sp. TaxID=158754 RepID=UPI00345AD2E1
MKHKASVVAAAWLLHACHTPPAPTFRADPAIDLNGRWSVVAVDGQRTGGGPLFWLQINPPVGFAQFGCNQGSGPLRIERGRLVPGEWVITTGACSGARMRFERRGFEIFSKPTAVERRADGVRLRNERGSLDLSPR